MSGFYDDWWRPDRPIKTKKPMERCTREKMLRQACPMFFKFDA